MYKSIQIFVPTHLKLMEKAYLRGISTLNLNQTLTIYFTAFSDNINILSSTKDKTIIYGYYNTNTRNCNFKPGTYYDYLEFDVDLKKGLKTLVIGNKIIDRPNEQIVFIYYDYNAVNYSENWTVLYCEDKFSMLHKLIQNEQSSRSKVYYDFVPVISKPSWLSVTMFGQHFLSYVDLVNWIKCSIKHDRKISIKQGNMILAILIDLFLGYLALQLFTQNKIVLVKSSMEAVETLVKYLFSLLEWIMGAPAGLKLNNAFNKMLGNIFSYHIQLWWRFLEVIGEKLDSIIEIFHWLGYLGFTFQAALVSDMICAVTFHSYCIYVYAARLFNIQISGLIALIRLFVGRKYNPLREGIDSCEYSNQELFVGTVAFTILLFLLPTTAMYYIVFTLFRLLSLAIQYLLTKVIYCIQTLPLYVILLWIMKSPKVAGTVNIDILKDVENEPLLLELNVSTIPLGTLLTTSRPPVKIQNPINWTKLLSNLLRGQQIT